LDKIREEMEFLFPDASKEKIRAETRKKFEDIKKKKIEQYYKVDI
jgi:hypothetical protein